MEHDVVAVACLLERHPLPAEQTAQLLRGLRELSFSASFRETVFGALSEERAGQLASSLLGDGSDAAVTVLRNACPSSAHVQLAVARAVGRGGTADEGRPLVLQMVCNAAVQNRAAAEEIASRWPIAEIDSRNATVAAALLHTLSVWTAAESARARLAQLANDLLPAILANFDFSVPSSALWLASVAAHSGRPLAELQTLLPPATLALAMEKFPVLLPWAGESGWIAAHLEEGLASFASLFADDSPSVRECAARLVLQHSCLQVCLFVFFALSSRVADAGAAGGRGSRGGAGG